MTNNSSLTTLPLHDLTDSELGSILSGFAYDLAPGASTFVTQTATITADSVNTATWTAYIGDGPSASAMDTATVTVELRGEDLPAAGTSQQAVDSFVTGRRKSHAGSKSICT